MVMMEVDSDEDITVVAAADHLIHHVDEAAGAGSIHLAVAGEDEVGWIPEEEGLVEEEGDIRSNQLSILPCQRRGGR